ncbi:hypothetical protein [Nocardioides flavescens]|uniref:Uncharacterized protein n=1 Tax=Nocardioides flavescens TaxID=2691959 RepID=A0A6L7F117_9ACTN|nr:hypothetical protein [Nocardioides flavescens]MXG90381.1 hypothetical protein [Nocardioides flavescens]
MTAERGRVDRLLALTALSYAACHHLGALPEGLGQAGRGTHVTDWIDLLLPFLVLGPALATLAAARASRATWAAAAVGSMLYASGHGIHLAANSIGNVAPGETAHLWDEQVGHWIWYAGVAVVAGALAAATRDRPLPGTRRGLVVAVLLAVAVGSTWATNATGGEFSWPGLGLAALASTWGVRHRHGPGLLLAVAGAAALVVVPVSLAVV